MAQSNREVCILCECGLVVVLVGWLPAFQVDRTALCSLKQGAAPLPPIREVHLWRIPFWCVIRVFQEVKSSLPSAVRTSDLITECQDVGVEAALLGLAWESQLCISTPLAYWAKGLLL